VYSSSCSVYVHNAHTLLCVKLVLILRGSSEYGTASTTSSSCVLLRSASSTLHTQSDTIAVSDSFGLYQPA
jgi:hypothetical protein